jgi:nitric oxide reductase subunit B
MNFKPYWVILTIITIVSFLVVGILGYQIYQSVPPIPQKIINTNGQVVFTKADINTGQAVWQEMGGQEVGTIWGHGAYLAPDWSADWLHKQATYMLKLMAKKKYSKTYKQINKSQRSLLQTDLQKILRKNSFNPKTKVMIITPLETKAIKHVANHFTKLFGDDPALETLRTDYSIPANTVNTAAKRHALTAFFYWAARACVTNRPHETISYTNNWPAERLVNNTPGPLLYLTSILSVVLLLAGIGALVWYSAFYLSSGFQDVAPKKEPSFRITAPMRATGKFFLIVGLLLLVQVLAGVLTAHYTVEGNEFFGLGLSKWIPYSIARTWHVQTGLFWIATALLGAGLLVSGLITEEGNNSKIQTIGIHFLWVCLLIIVVGSLAGEYLGMHHHFSLWANFWFGMQGYEYVDLGRFWQIFLFIGLLLWLVLMLKSIVPAIKKANETRHLIVLFILSCITIGCFYVFGLFWGQHTNLGIEEYWRWWVVHLWVEGFFEVFTTVVIAFLFVKLGLIKAKVAIDRSLLATILYMAGGIIGIFHHLYFTGTPQPIIMLGGIFSALEVVPLALIGLDAYHNLRLSRLQPWVETYKWPIYYFIAVCFWNLVGAGLLGFLINMPIALYFVQGLNTTPLHGHAALYGVYGNLAIGLSLFSLTVLWPHRKWSEPALKYAFWLLNIGIAAQCFLSLLPIGLLQVWTSLTQDMWYARSAAFTHSPLLHSLIWLRAIGDILFGIGVLVLIYAMFFTKKLKTLRNGLSLD